MSVAGAIRRVLRVGDRLLLDLAARSSFFSTIYYCLFSRAFWREHFAVARGRWRYLNACKSPQGCQYLLRRNIHRIEKGLLMKPRRDVFAIDYVEETVDCYARMTTVCTDNTDPHELAWARGVLKAYFEAVGRHARIDAARKRFESLSGSERGESELIPIRCGPSSPPSVAYHDFLELARRRRSVRWFLPKSVSRELIDQAITVASLSPSACNRQAFEFRVLDEPELVRRVASIPQGTSGFYESFSVVIAAVGKLSAYAVERDRHIIYIDIGIAAMSLMYALETVGLSSCCLNFPEVDAQEREIASILGLEPDDRVVVLIATGYADPEGMVACSEKKSLDALRRYNL